MPEISQEAYREITKRVVRYYRKNKRDLPWRKRSDGYGIWISEIMLQQTRVSAVIPYYQRWLKSFPTIKKLAAAELDEVLSHWSGLGYYSRARNIHKSAKEVQHRYKGRMPRTAKELRTLPGIGRYTAGAISSIAYRQQEALVDGNVARLLARLFEIEEDIKSTSAIKDFWQHCEHMVPAHAPGDFNQGLMELGALICIPKNPKCTVCPVRPCCGAYVHERTQQLPKVAKRKRDKDKKLLSSHAAFLRRNGKILLGHRKTEGLFGGLWEFPQAESKDKLSELTGLRLEFTSTKAAYLHKQILTHRRLKISVWTAIPTGRTKLAPGSAYQRLAWYSAASLSTLGISSATKVILDQIPSNNIEHRKSSIEKRT